MARPISRDGERSQLSVYMSMRVVDAIDSWIDKQEVKPTRSAVIVAATERWVVSKMGPGVLDPELDPDAQTQP